MMEQRTEMLKAMRVSKDIVSILLLCLIEILTCGEHNELITFEGRILHLLAMLLLLWMQLL